MTVEAIVQYLERAWPNRTYTAYPVADNPDGIKAVVVEHLRQVQLFSDDIKDVYRLIVAINTDPVMGMAQVAVTDEGSTVDAKTAQATARRIGKALNSGKTLTEALGN